MQRDVNEMRTPVHIAVFASRYPVERAVMHQAIRQNFSRVVHRNSARGLVLAQQAAATRAMGHALDDSRNGTIGVDQAVKGPDRFDVRSTDGAAATPS